MNARNGEPFLRGKRELRLAHDEDVAFQVGDQLHLTVEQGVLETDLREHQQHRERNAHQRDGQTTPVVREIFPSQRCFAFVIHGHYY